MRIKFKSGKYHIVENSKIVATYDTEEEAINHGQPKREKTRLQPPIVEEVPEDLNLPYDIE